jgi:hypothetical protein
MTSLLCILCLTTRDVVPAGELNTLLGPPDEGLGLSLLVLANF